MKRKRKKILRLGGTFLTSFLISGLVLSGLVIFKFSEHLVDRVETFEQKGEQAFINKKYSLALQHWLKIPKDSQTDILYTKIGNTYLKLSNLEQAELFFNKAVKKNPLNIDNQKSVVRISLIKGDLQKAEDSLSMLKNRMESDPDILMLSGDLHLLKGDIEKASISYRMAMSFAPKRVRPIVKLAICLEQQEKNTEAVKLLSKIDKIEEASDLMLIADFYILTGNNLKAESYILKAIETDSKNIGFRIRLCKYYRSTGQLDKAEKYLTLLADQYPKNTGFKLMLADISLSRLDLTNAKKWLDNVGQIKNDSTEFQLIMGKYWLFKGQYSQAVSFFNTALDRNYGLVSAHYLLGSAYFAGGQIKLAEIAFVNALMLVPNHIDALLAIAGLHYKNKEYALSIQYIEKILSVDPLNFSAWQIKGLCFMEQDRYELAFQAFSKALELNNTLSALFFLGRSYEGQKLHQAALDIYESILDEYPDMVDVLYYYSWVLQNQSEGDRALKKIDTWIEKGKNYPGIYYLGAKISLSLKKYSTSKKYIDRAMATENTSGEFYILLSELYKEKNEFSEVEKTLQMCTKKQPLFKGGWLHLSAYYIKYKNSELAKKVLEEAIKHFPDQPEIMGNLAWVLLKDGSDPDRALDLARKAYDKMPGQAWLMDTLGWAYYHKQAYSQADWMLAQAEELSTNEGIIHYHRGMVFYRQGKLLKAKEKLEYAVSLSIDTSYKEKASTILAGLKGKKRLDDQDDYTNFNLENFPSTNFPEDISKEKEDILKPDWNKMN